MNEEPREEGKPEAPSGPGLDNGQGAPSQPHGGWRLDFTAHAAKQTPSKIHLVQIFMIVIQTDFNTHRPRLF
jgi:hypothetical protein